MVKTIVVHIDGSPEQDSRLRAAALLATEHGAHLVGSAATGISWRAYVLLAGAAGVPVPEPEADFQAMRDAARARLDGFQREAARRGVAATEARLDEDDTRHALLLQSRYADLVVLSQDAPPAPAGSAPARERHLPEFLALHGARPVLVVPQHYEVAAIPGVAVAGWDGSLQAMRAIAAALPLLQRAESVKLALINPQRLSELQGEEPGADMALYLARHGVRAEVVCERTNVPSGTALVGLARDCKAGLLVAGAFGHSRYREWVLGGATRELLERTPVPLLLAH